MGEEGRGNEGKKSPTPSPSFKKKNLFSLLSLYWQRTFTGLTLGAAASAAPASESPLPLPLWRLLVLTACRRKREKKKEEEGGELKKVSGAKNEKFFLSSSSIYLSISTHLRLDSGLAGLARNSDWLHLRRLLGLGRFNFDWRDRGGLAGLSGAALALAEEVAGRGGSAGKGQDGESEDGGAGNHCLEGEVGCCWVTGIGERSRDDDEKGERIEKRAVVGRQSRRKKKFGKMLPMLLPQGSLVPICFSRAHADQ